LVWEHHSAFWSQDHSKYPFCIPCDDVIGNPLVWFQFCSKCWCIRVLTSVIGHCLKL
jgi:hypothetical protein